MSVFIESVVVRLTARLALVTLLLFAGSRARWVRMWDFPRAQIAGALAATIGLAFGALDGGPALAGACGRRLDAAVAAK